MKKCSHCKTEKPLTEFYGSKIWCKVCDKQAAKDYMNRVKSDPYLFKKYEEKRKAKYLEKKATWHLQPDRKCKCCGLLKPRTEYYFNYYKCKPCTLYEKSQNYARHNRTKRA